MKAVPRVSVLVTGASGYVGSLVVKALAGDRRELHTIIATDVRSVAKKDQLPGVEYEPLDITDRARLTELLRQYDVDTVVHLAAIVTPRPGDSREMQYAVDVDGTENVTAACIKAGVRKLVYTSSGAAYGYHADNAPMLREDDALRGNEEFAYAWHKRLVEDQLARAATENPELEQLIFRVSTVLERPIVMGLDGADTPFCFIWDSDLVECLCNGVHGSWAGTFNLTGDGVMTLREIATSLGRRYVSLPTGWVKKGLAFLNQRDLTPYGPEQVAFLLHRPVLDNGKLRRELGYRPSKTSREVFALYKKSRG
ncbi:MAG: NAD-dependent epimerase/dehydratase family protein [Deltaproteobacteria bacterium]|nr:NAD-dependent epimerase/dehydratase family protein [Deltaproteobacteria bacterium]